MGIFHKSVIPKIVPYLFLISNVLVSAQKVEPGENTLEETVGTFYQAMIDKNETVLKTLTLPELSYGHSSGTIENHTQFLEAVIKGPFEFLHIDTEEPKYSVLDDVGVVRHILQADGADAGEATNVRIGVMMIFKKTGEGWKLLARQAYKL
ncbi:nuclear transport factor 2 family protein [Flavobacteriaceae bacterium TP-CH-4]|uniref:Nuclear transport factor 2 family protein n=1 Tax=Pelagihabitans pacificus TaxID=2696054 RepID=A0A967ARN7_9FLAO|nr:nuclear transport factor 2 family protein [Pelagihabitans pacificus]NHF58747.1 nuclear transport factor 2 family protein [Pelagihabitans pacificus]